MRRTFLLWGLLETVVRAENVTIFKVDYPTKGFCGQENDVEKSWENPHWLFPMTFGGFTEGNCSDVGYGKFKEETVVEMHPVPWVHHNLTFDIYEATQTKIHTIELADTSRAGRIVKAKLCMHIDSGTQPLYIFGHGAGCAPDDYLYFCQVAATAMIYQDSPAGPIFPADFDTAGAAIDASFLAAQLPSLSKNDPSSVVFGKLDGTVVLGGHSMGGGVAFLAGGRQGATADGVAVFAPGLYTKPDATPYLKNVTVPTLIVSGSMDCGQNALDKQAEPAFQGLASTSKVLVVLKGANHCQWTQPMERFLGVCKTFEANECHDISRAEQHRRGASLVRAFSAGLKSEGGWEKFEEILAQGEAKGQWAFITSKNTTKTLTNDCPCTGMSTSPVIAPVVV